ncbi:hypothetical protein AWH56_016015 [Anaerobacillus isosaccharinicus]|uniref:Uncharacterized protein n=1 Tax=Anaerobacillus isosaccharinicus TaxID=1532552 RepID=A0A1S2M653_9BACI|nr:hypothetical protein [Anaerobacillus isosaccharinicus]MBA5587594.1 hypothetical protein [Anaerobacillus isosaccharinicus]QOY34230.1 hypothetical protein AWH56_016015 [Anaerobacillus isosaccharinicus]
MKKYKETRYSTNGKYKVFGILFSDNALPLIHVDVLNGKKKRIYYNSNSKLPKYIAEICEEIQMILINQNINN